MGKPDISGSRTFCNWLIIMTANRTRPTAILTQNHVMNKRSRTCQPGKSGKSSIFRMPPCPGRFGLSLDSLQTESTGLRIWQIHYPSHGQTRYSTAIKENKGGRPCWARTNDQRIMRTTSAFAARFRFVVWTLSCLSAFPSSLYTFSKLLELRSALARCPQDTRAFTEFEKFYRETASYSGQPMQRFP